MNTQSPSFYLLEKTCFVNNFEMKYVVFIWWLYGCVVVDVSESSTDVTQTEPVLTAGWDRDVWVASILQILYPGIVTPFYQMMLLV